MDWYAEMIYGWCLSRVIHFIVTLRAEHPSTPIYIAKYDYSDAYRRVSHSASAAVQSIIILFGVAYIALRLAFGGAPNPPTWCAFSEMVTDLSNEISLCEDWDPDQLHSPVQETTPVPKKLDDSVEFGQARSLAVEIPVQLTSRTDSFIDDLIRIFLGSKENEKVGPHAVPLAIFVTSRPHSGETELIKRRSILSEQKLEAEGLPVEIQIVLGWDLDTRRLLVILPLDKYLAWNGDIEKVINERAVTFGELESTVGRLNHVSYLIPLSRHFLHRLRKRIKHRRSEKQKISLTSQEIFDLALWQDFLRVARAGVSMNRLTVRTPSQLGLADSCPFGLGGYTFAGRAWRITIPKSSPLYGVSKANNVFEFLALAVTVWLIIIDCNAQGLRHECILQLGDSTSAMGWLYKANNIRADSFYYEPVHMIARKLARVVMDSSHCLAGQHLKGDFNLVSDLLSYEGSCRNKPHPLAFDSPDDATLTHRFHSVMPQLIPESFQISPLPKEILSFVIRVLQTTESSFTQKEKLHTRAKTESSDAGKATFVQWASTITPSSITFPRGNASSSFEHFSLSTGPLDGTDQGKLLDTVCDQWLQTLSGMPQAIWLRRFGTISNGAPFTSKGARGSFLPSGRS